jgi:hypothetical protein
VKTYKMKFLGNVMLPHSWMEKVCVTDVNPPSVDCSKFKEWEQVNSSKILHNIFFTM